RAAEPGPRAVVLDRVGLDPAELAPRFADLKLSVARRAELPVASLGTGSWEAYVEGLSAKLRKRLRYIERTLAKQGEVAVREVAAPGELEAGLATLCALHDRRWGERGGSSLAAGPARDFHARFAAAALDRGWLRLRLLEVDGAAVAALYGWRLGRTY